MSEVPFQIGRTARFFIFCRQMSGIATRFGLTLVARPVGRKFAVTPAARFAFSRRAD